MRQAPIRRLLLGAAIATAACAPQGERLPVQAPDEVAAAMIEAVRACSAGLTPDGSIDQAAMAARGWRVERRSTRLEAQTRELAADAHPQLRPGEYEATLWARDGIANRIELIRMDGRTGSPRDSCSLAARTSDRAAAERVAAALGRHFGRRPDRSGVQPRGGDFLTPRSDPEQYAHHWAMPGNDAYLTISEEGDVRLEVLAMADRDALDRFSPDRPENRIPAPPAP